MIRSILLANILGLVSFASIAGNDGTKAQEVVNDLAQYNNFVPRDVWGAMEISPERAKSCGLKNDPDKNTIVVLSTGDSVNTKEVRCPQIVEGDYVRRSDATFCGTGTNFVIGADGTIYEGRNLEYQAACSVPNKGVIGITVAGCFDDVGCESPTEFNLDEEASLVHLIAHLAYHYQIEINEEYVLPMSRRTSAEKFRSSPGNRVTSRWTTILDEADKRKQALYSVAPKKEF
jgi:N-acetylmuramoyl-L-alanine amidase